MKNLAIIPARSGSKGLEDKNIKELNGKPMIAYTIKAAIESKLFDEIMVSTDSEKYAVIAREHGANVPFLRGSELSSDSSSSWDVVRDVVLQYEERGNGFDTIALLQPTSPLRNYNDIIEGYKIMEQKDANLIVAVCESEHSPLWSNTLPDDFSMKNFIRPELASVSRQELPKYYRINGALYIIKTGHLMNNKDIYCEKSYAMIMKRENSVDIDNQVDFLFARVLLSKQDDTKQ